MLVQKLVPDNDSGYDGTGTGAIVAPSDQAVDIQATVVSGGANHIVTLPNAPIGSTVTLYAGNATGYEIRTHAPATVGINGGTGASAESAIAASTTVWLERVSATNWNGWSRVADGTLSVVQVAA